MSWQKGAVWFGGIGVFSIGYAIVYTIGDSLILLGLLLMFTGLIAKWNTEGGENE